MHSSSRREQRAKWIKWGAVAVVLGFAVLASIAAYFAVQSRNNARESALIANEQALKAKQQEQEADKARIIAEQQARVAKARQLAAQSQIALEKYPQRSLLLAVEALNVTLQKDKSYVPDAEQALRDALANVGGRVLPDPVGGIPSVAISADSHWLAIGSGDGSTQLIDLTASDPITTTIVLSRGDEQEICGIPGCQQRISSIAFSADNRWLATGSEDGVRLWDLTKLALIAPPIILGVHEVGISSVAFSADSHWLAAGSWGGTAQLWDLTQSDPSIAPIPLRGHKMGIRSVTFSADNHWLATAGPDGTARLWDLTQPDPSLTSIVLYGYERDISNIGSAEAFRTSREAFSVAFSADSHWLAMGTDFEARLWNLTKPDPSANSVVLDRARAMFWSVTFSTDNHWLATGSLDGTALLWDLTKPDLMTNPLVLGDLREVWSVIGLESEFRNVVFSLDNRWLVTGSNDGTVRLWDLTQPEPINIPIVLRGHEAPIRNVVLSGDKHWLVTSSLDGTARLWDLKRSDPVATPLIFHNEDKSPILSMAISADNHWLVTGGFDSVRRWDLTQPDLTITNVISGLGGYKAIKSMGISEDAHWLVTGGRDSTVKLWDLTQSDPSIAPIPLRGHKMGIRSVTFSADNHWLATAGPDGTARLWDLTRADPIVTPIVFRGGKEKITSVAISADNHWLVTGGSDGAIRLWDLTRSDPTTTPIILRGHADLISHIAFSPESHWLVTVAGGNRGDTVRLWDLAKTDLEGTVIILGEPGQSISSVAFSADSHWLAMGMDMDIFSRVATIGTIWLWNLLKPVDAPIVLRGHEHHITSIAFTTDSHWLITGSWDNTARLWDLTASDPAAMFVVLRKYEVPITEVAISADNRWIITGNNDGTTQLWTLNLSELLVSACQTAGRNFSDHEWDQYFRGEPYHLTCPDLPIHDSIIIKGRELAQNGNIDAAVALFQRVIEVDPRVKLDPKTEAQIWAIKGTSQKLINRGEQLARQGNIKEAVAAYKQAQTSNPLLEIPTYSWNTLCRYGSLWSQAAAVLDACEQAVALAPDDGDYRDSRGLARALTGNFEGAIADFEAFVQWTKDEQKKAQRQQWIEALRKGENPFTPEVLEELRAEYLQEGG